MQAVGQYKINTAEVDRRIEELMKDPSMAGLSIAIIENGRVTFAKGYGETLKGSGDKVTADTVFRWASLSKSVAAATVLDLEEEGRFSLASPVKAYAPSLTLPPSKYPATIEHVLSHRVGITSNAFDRQIEAGKTGQQVRLSLARVKQTCDPGSCHNYQNAAFDATAEIVENTTRMPYKSVVAERLFRPLNMNTASLTLEGLVTSRNWAKPHKIDGRIVPNVKPTYYRVPAAAGVNSSVRDLSKWILALMGSDPTVVSQRTLQKMETPKVPTPKEDARLRRNYYALTNAQYGLGLRIYNYEGRKVVGHRGAVQGYRAVTLFDPALKTGVAIMWNSPHSRPIGLQLEVMDQVYGKPRRDWMRLGQRRTSTPIVGTAVSYGLIRR